MTDSYTDRKHFTQAVVDFGSRRSVVTTRAIYNSKGIKIVEQGVPVHPGLYERLMQHQLSTPLEDSVSSLPTVGGRVFRHDAEDIIQSAPFFAHMVEDHEVRGFLLDTLEKIPLPEPVAFQLTLAHQEQPALYRHLLYTALVAAWLAVEPRISRFNMGIAAAAGLLHDLGMLHLDPLLLDHKSDISPEQRRQLYAHPIVSAVLIERHPEYPEEVVRAVMEHHEFLDGSGYPRNLAGDAISRTGRILALAELITGAFAPGREAPELRLSILLRMNRHRYDEALSEKVCHLLRPQSEAEVPITLLDDPVGCLSAIDSVLAAWPTRLAGHAGLPLERQRNFALLTEQATQLHRTLGRAGAAPEQLNQIGKDALNQALRAELTLLAREASWQLRTLARQVRYRWNARPDTGFPAEFQQWLERVDDAVAHFPSDSGPDNAAPLPEAYAGAGAGIGK